MASTLFGRDAELARLGRLGTASVGGEGALVLVRGEAGVGKTALGRAVLARSDATTVVVAVGETPAPAYTPVAGLLRAAARDLGPLLAGAPALRRCLAPLLPELGESIEITDHDQRLLFEAVAAAIAELADAHPLAVLLDDIHWADDGTLDALAHLGDVIPRWPVLLIATYRSDAVPRGHPLRRLRTELRRRGRLLEIPIEPLDAEAGASLLESRLGGAAADTLKAAVRDRAEGIPFFVEEIASTLVENGSLRQGVDGFELDPQISLPVPDTVRDAILQRVDRLPADLRDALVVASIAGQQFDPGTVSDLLPDPEVMHRLAISGLVEEDPNGQQAFRHGLIRDALYSSVPWPRRRELHRRLAERLQIQGAPAAAVAAHWLAAGETAPAREWLVAAARASQQACAYRDATRQLTEALERWPSTADHQGRSAALQLLADCAERTGELALAVRALTETAEVLDRDGEMRGYADAQRRLATLHEQAGAWERGLTAHQLAAAAYAAVGELGDAAGERLAAAARLRSAGCFTAALELIAIGRIDAQAAGRPDLEARLLALEGNVRARAGDSPSGLPLVRSALSQALTAGQLTAAAEAYQRLADSLEHAGDYRAARDTYTEAAAFCRTHDALAVGDVCLACLTMVLRQGGEWERASQLSNEVVASPTSTPHALAVVHGVLGSILAHRGHERQARAELHLSNVLAHRIGLAAMEMDSEVCLARLAATQGRRDEALERCAQVLRRWHRTDCERHYSIPVLRWMATFATDTRSAEMLHACGEALDSIASRRDPEAVAALSHARGEEALLQREYRPAAVHFEQALATLADLELPFERAEIEVRAAMAHGAGGNRPRAIQLYRRAHRTARRLGARPLATRIAQQVAALGEKVEQRLGRLAATGLGRGGLSPRELEVARLVADGRTDREIAAVLSLSPRTVEMHIHRTLVKLDCRTRVDIARRATEWGLTSPVGAAPA
jgi:ATP/maltotriose-dependent transcriptional regulator MalT